MDELAAKRAFKAQDSRLWSVEDALEDVLKRLRAGEVKPHQIAIHWFEKQEAGGYRHDYTVAGLTFQEHLALLLVAERNTMNRWVE